MNVVYTSCYSHSRIEDNFSLHRWTSLRINTHHQRQQEAYLCDAEHDVYRCAEWVDGANQFTAHHLREGQRHGLAEHHGFRLDSSDPCEEETSSNINLQYLSVCLHLPAPRKDTSNDLKVSSPHPRIPRPLIMVVWESVPTTLSGYITPSLTCTTRDRYSKLT